MDKVPDINFAQIFFSVMELDGHCNALSQFELDTQIQIAINLKYLNSSEIEKLSKTVNHIFAMLSKLIQKIKNDEKM